MRVVRVPDLTVQHMEKFVGMVLAGSGMQVGRRTGGVMVLNALGSMRSTVWAGEMQFGGRLGKVMVMNATVQVRSTLWVRETQFDERSGGDGDEHSSSGEVDDMGRREADR